jgi:hypothetical protein
MVLLVVVVFTDQDSIFVERTTPFLFSEYASFFCLMRFFLLLTPPFFSILNQHLLFFGGVFLLQSPPTLFYVAGPFSLAIRTTLFLTFFWTVMVFSTIFIAAPPSFFCFCFFCFFFAPFFNE